MENKEINEEFKTEKDATITFKKKEKKKQRLCEDRYLKQKMNFYVAGIGN